MNPILQLLLDLASQIITFTRWAFWPTVKEVWRSPSLLVHPLVLRRTFFSHVWAEFSQHLDSMARPIKEKLVRPYASGIVLDIGAGHGHTVLYLDKSKVTRYIALEPNTSFHTSIRRIAMENGFVESDGSLVILGMGAEDIGGIIAALGPQSIDTFISIHSLCSVPSPKATLRALVQRLLRPGGQLLSFEHTDSPLASVRRLQAVLNPMWINILDGCTLGRPIFEWIRASDDWATSDEWVLEDDTPVNLFYHRVGRFVRKE